jgi:hypothetical protein
MRIARALARPRWSILAQFTSLCCTALGMGVFSVSPAHAWSLQCALGTTLCIKTQGIELPSSDAIELLDRCEEFTKDGLGRRAMTLSASKLEEFARGRVTPLVMAWTAYEDIHDSPLKFDRSAPAGKQYSQIARACAQLDRDFDRQVR